MEFENLPEGWRIESVNNILESTDYVANGSFKALKDNVSYKDIRDYAVLIRLTDYNHNWKSDFVYVDKKAYDFLKKSYITPKDIIISNVGANVGTVFQAPDLNIPMTLGPNSILIRPKTDDIDRDYIFYYFKSYYGQNQLNSIVSGSAQPKFNKTDLRNLKLPIPSLPKQQKIASILGALDDKIELNNQMNQTLETMAKALFKSWFVDFDPFQEREFEESELGMIPKGWKVAGIDDIGEFLNGIALQKFPPEEGKPALPVIKIRELKAGITANTDLASADIKPQYIIDNGDLLFSWSGTLEVSFWGYGRGALNQHLFKVSSATYPIWFVYGWILQHLEDFRHTAASKATTMGHIQRKHLTEAKVLIPDDETIQKAHRVFKPVIERFKNNLVEIRTLSTTRDSLLAKLMGGELNIDVE